MKLVKNKSSTRDTVYQLKITLHDEAPEIWRRVLVPGSFNLGKLHHVIQIAMGWTNSHLHEFEINKIRYIYPDHDPDHAQAVDEKSFKLFEIPENINTFEYRYDFGDGWQHKIIVENILEKNEIYHYPVCVDGNGACPPEDCGGMGGYGELLKQIENKQNKEHHSTMQWLGGQFDPHSFDANRVNRDGLWKKRW